MESGDWPHARLESFAPAVYAQIFARNLAGAMDGRALREVARAAELDPMTVRALLRGERFPDMVSVTKLELAFRRLLWPRDSARIEYMREMVGADRSLDRERRELQLLGAFGALADAWEAQFGVRLAEPQQTDADGRHAGSQL